MVVKAAANRLEFTPQERHPHEPAETRSAPDGFSSVLFFILAVPQPLQPAAETGDDDIDSAAAGEVSSASAFPDGQSSTAGVVLPQIETVSADAGVDTIDEIGTTPGRSANVTNLLATAAESPEPPQPTADIQGQKAAEGSRSAMPQPGQNPAGIGASPFESPAADNQDAHQPSTTGPMQTSDSPAANDLHSGAGETATAKHGRDAAVTALHTRSVGSPSEIAPANAAEPIAATVEPEAVSNELGRDSIGLKLRNENPAGAVAGVSTALSSGSAAASREHSPTQKPGQAPAGRAPDASAQIEIEPAASQDVAKTAHGRASFNNSATTNGDPDGASTNPRDGKETEFRISDERPHNHAPENIGVPQSPAQADRRGGDVAPTDWRPAIQRIADEISGRVKLNRQQAVLQLDPPELGKVDIDLQIHGDKIQAHIIAQTDESRALIENHIQDLRHALQAHKLDLVDFRVENGNASGTGSDLTESFQQQSKGREQWSGAEPRPTDSGQALDGKRPQRFQQHGRVSMWA